MTCFFKFTYALCEGIFALSVSFVALKLSHFIKTGDERSARNSQYDPIGYLFYTYVRQMAVIIIRK